MLTQDELAQYQQDADDEAAQNNADRGKRLRRVAVQLLAMAATLTGISSGGSVEDPLDAPTLAWDDETSDNLPDFTIEWDAEVNDIVTLRRSTSADFASYTDAQDTVDSLSPPTTLQFDFGGVWPNGTYYVKCFYTRSGVDSTHSSTETVTIAADTTAPTLSSATDTKTGQTTADISVSTNEANGTLYYAITTSSTPPTATQVKNGQNQAGSAAVSAASVVVASTGVKSWSITGLTAGTQYYTYFMHEDQYNNQSSVAAADGFLTDSAQPTLSSPTDTTLSQTEGTLGVTTDTANGTLYYVVTTSTTPPSATQVKAGQNHSGAAAPYAGSQAISSTGAKTATASGLTANTQYYAYFMHENATGGQSSVSAANGFLTGLADSYISASEENINAAPAGTGPWTYTYTNKSIGTADSRRYVVVAITTAAGTSGAVHDSLTANAGAVTFTKIATGSTGAHVTTLWEAAVSAGTSLTSPILTISGGAPARTAFRLWTHGRGAATGTPIGTSGTSIASLGGTIDVPSRGLVITHHQTTSELSVPHTPTGFTEDYEQASVAATLTVTGGRYANTGGAETGRNITYTYSATANNCRMTAAAFGAAT